MRTPFYPPSPGQRRIGVTVPWLVLTVMAGSPAAWAQTGTATATAGAPDGAAAGATDGASNDDRAREHFKVAMGLYNTEKYVQALLEFKKAYELSPRAAITYNIARCYEKLGQWQAAIVAYERFVTETTDATEKSEALDKIEFLRTKLGDDAGSPDARYRARIEAGKKAYARGNYESAIEEFKAAYDIKASSGVLFNIAKAYERLARYEEAIDFYKQYLESEPNAKDRPDVEETIRRLTKSIRERFQELYVASDPPGADIFLDDAEAGLQGQTNYRFKVTPGPHVLFLELNGYEPVKREFVMPDDKPLALEFKMKKLENVGHAEINVNIDGARIFIDGAIIGLSPYKKKKALEVGPHQLVVEAFGFPRHTQEFVIERDKTVTMNVKLEGVQDKAAVGDALSRWGRNLIVLGILGGGLGFAGPFAYQKIVLRRDLTEHLGPEQVSWGAGVLDSDSNYYRGNPKTPTGAIREAGSTDLSSSFRENKSAKTLENIQLAAVISGSALIASGLGLYIIKWSLPDEKDEFIITSQRDEPDSGVQITGLGVAPSPNGATLGLSGSF